MQSSRLDSFLARIVAVLMNPSCIMDVLMMRSRLEPRVPTMLPPVCCSRNIASTASFSTHTGSCIVSDPSMSARERRQGTGVA